MVEESLNILGAEKSHLQFMPEKNMTEAAAAARRFKPG